MGKNNEYREMAHRYIPGGAHTYSRADDAYPINVPSVLSKGQDAYVWDVEGNRYLDYGMGLRAVTIGYNNQRISQAAIEQIHFGNGLTRASQIEVDAAKLLCEIIPSADMVKFAKNGSTVTTAAVKLARAYTGKKYVARCKEHPFFSYDDWFIGDTIMDSGIPDAYKSLTLDFHFNDIESLKGLVEKYPDEIAAVILEPATTEEPLNDFLQKVQALCKENGIVFILDEMITGFRWDLRGAAHYYGVEPDLITFGKGMANGFSVAALCGKREIMELGGITHNRERVFLISTTHGAEMCGMGAFVETMKIYQEENVTAHLWSIGKKLIDGCNQIIQDMNLSDYFQFIGPSCSPGYITRNRKKEISLDFRTLYIQEMASNGVLMPWIALSHAHRDEEIEMTIEAFTKAMKIYSLALEGNIDNYLLGRPIKPVFRKYN